LPEYNIIIKNRPYKVELAKKEDKGQFEARVNDKPLELEIEEGETGAHSPLTLRVAGKMYLAELDRIDRHTPFTLKINDAIFQVQLKEPVKTRAAPISAAPAVARAEKHRGTAAPEGSIVAPMAGKIVSVRVKKGDAVKAGDVVCILEAMKMENEITAAKAGTVQEVNVSEGTAVNEGSILVIMK
jgi:biotin carboxyl carrier protein